VCVCVCEVRKDNNTILIIMYISWSADYTCD